MWRIDVYSRIWIMSTTNWSHDIRFMNKISKFLRAEEKYCPNFKVKPTNLEPTLTLKQLSILYSMSCDIILGCVYFIVSLNWYQFLTSTHMLDNDTLLSSLPTPPLRQDMIQGHFLCGI